MLSQITISEGFDTIQRIITQDINTPSPVISCICNHQGKVTQRFWLSRKKTQLVLWIEEESQEQILNALKHYDIQETLKIQDIKCVSHQSTEIISEENWPITLIKNKIITITPELINQHTPFALGLIEHNAICFEKGCFIGHEPIARVKYRGKSKKSLTYTQSKELPSTAVNCYHDGENYHSLSITLNQKAPHAL